MFGTITTDLKLLFIRLIKLAGNSVKSLVVEKYFCAIQALTKKERKMFENI